MKFPHLEKFTDLLKGLKYEHQSIFPLWGGSNLILETGSENRIFFLRTPAAVKLFLPNCQKMTLWHKKENHYPATWICITHIWPPHYSLAEL